MAFYLLYVSSTSCSRGPRRQTLKPAADFSSSFPLYRSLARVEVMRREQENPRVG